MHNKLQKGNLFNKTFVQTYPQNAISYKLFGKYIFINPSVQALNHLTPDKTLLNDKKYNEQKKPEQL